MRRRKNACLVRQTIVGVVIFVSLIAVTGPFGYNDDVYRGLNDATHRWSWLGGQVLGLDITAPRQNVFSLLYDISHPVKVTDHSINRTWYLIGLANWLNRGSIYTVADALKWLDIPLTTRQARLVGLCRRMSDGPIVIQPDAWQYGIASWYGPGFHGRLAASGEIYNMFDETAAHRTLPLGTFVRVVSQRTGLSTVVRINDRGPYVAGRVIDMSYGAKEMLGMQDLAAVYLEKIDPKALEIRCE